MITDRNLLFSGAAAKVGVYFWKSLRNTAYFAVGTLTLQLPIALLLAILLNSKFVKGKNFLRLAFFAPVLVAGVFVAIIFNLVYDQRAGLVNHEFVLFGKEIGWPNEENYVMPAVILTGVWQWAGFNMVYFLAGLQGIRQELLIGICFLAAQPPRWGFKRKES